MLTQSGQGELGVGITVALVVLGETQPLTRLPLQVAEEAPVRGRLVEAAVLEEGETLVTIVLGVLGLRQILAVAQVTATMAALDLVGEILEVVEAEHPRLVRLDKL